MFLGVFLQNLKDINRSRALKKRGSGEELEVTFSVKMEERAVKEEVDSDETPSGEAN